MKKVLITLALIVIIILLVVIATRQPTTTIISTPRDQVDLGEPTPRAPPEDRGEPTPKAPEVVAPPNGVPAEIVYPRQVDFWVNSVQAPISVSQGHFIPVEDDDIKTFAGSFGPYFDDPTPYIKVVLCAELENIAAAPACERVPIIFRENYVTFARGYQFDEYIGGQAAKDYFVYYTVYAGDTSIAFSNKAYIRTVRD